MQKLSNRIKKYAIKNFDVHLDETLFLDILNEDQTKQSSIHCDEQINLKQQNSIAFGIRNSIKSKPKITKKKLANSYHTQPLRDNNFYNYQLQVPNATNQEQKAKIIWQRSNKTVKTKYKNFIQLQNFQKFESEKNIAMDHKIQKLRKLKLETNDKDQKRSKMFQKQRIKYKQNMQNYSSKKVEANFRNRNGNGYVPIGYEGQILQKKVSKQSDLAKYNIHFIDMQIEVDSDTVVIGSDGKQSSSKKQCENQNHFDKIRQKKLYEIFNARNICHPIFRARTNVKKIDQNNGNEINEKKFMNFVNKNQKNKVQLTLRQLMQFKEAVYRKREEQYFKFQQEASNCQRKKSQKQERKTSRSIQMQNKNGNMVKRKQVTIENLKNYEELVGFSIENNLDKRNSIFKNCSFEQRFTHGSKIQRNHNYWQTARGEKPLRKSLKSQRKTWRSSSKWV